MHNLIATEIAKTALDVRIGFLHATNRRKNSLNLDIADVFKPLIVDRVVFSLINRRSIRPCHFKTFENGAVYLNTEGKREFISAFEAKVSAILTVKGAEKDYYSLLQDEVAKLVRYFRGTEKYRAFRQVR